MWYSFAEWQRGKEADSKQARDVLQEEKAKSLSQLLSMYGNYSFAYLSY